MTTSFYCLLPRGRAQRALLAQPDHEPPSSVGWGLPGRCVKFNLTQTCPKRVPDLLSNLSLRPKLGRLAILSLAPLSTT